jgi:hypothetical protein
MPPDQSVQVEYDGVSIPIPRSTYEKSDYKPDFDKLPFEDEYKAADEKLRNAPGPTPLGLTAICRITLEKQLSKALRFGDVLTNFVSLIGFAGISQQMLKLGSTSQIQADWRISR